MNRDEYRRGKYVWDEDEAEPTDADPVEPAAVEVEAEYIPAEGQRERGRR